MRIAVLALQGAFAEHERILSELGISSFEIRQRPDLGRSFDGLIIPGGESTVQGKLLRELTLFLPLRDAIASGLPVFGTCAGLLLLARRIRNDDRAHLATMDITAVRNAYGRQLGSFHTEADFQGIGRIPMTFIRAPYIEEASGDATVLATVNGQIVAARQGNQLVTAFHPELDQDLSVHAYFASMIEKNMKTEWKAASAG
ncbi:MAG: pyridoxal 5'-phosphate synthase glutaminase subunit PdxT [Clostridiales bacterium]|nr:pyridoxal 5'-phosphate synthase glutaminase subunit PdxT [Clostridiales bacterium]